MTEFRGIYPALITPMTDEGDLNEEAFRRLIDFDIEAGAHGFWIAGGTGESVLVADDENRRISEIAVTQAAGRVPIIMHVGAPSTQRTIALAEHAAAAGVDAICSVPPFFYQPSDAEIARHYREVAAATSLPFFAYNLPSCTGVELTPKIVARLQDEVPEFAGLKHSAPSFINVREFVRMGAATFIGSCQLILPALCVGAVGCIDGPPCCAPDVYLAVWNAFAQGDMPAALAAQDRAIDVCGMLTRSPYFASVKVACSEQIGLDCGVPRPPLSPLTDQQRRMLVASLHGAGVLAEPAAAR